MLTLGMCKWRRRGRRTRPAFTVIELLVSISVIAMLMALLLPAVQQAREAGRRNTCENNLRNLSLAMLASADAMRRYPASGDYGFDHSGNVQSMHSWVVPLLPWLERAEVARQWDLDKPLTDRKNKALAQIHLDVLACPDDITVVGAGDLSYVVNGGIGFTARIGHVDDCPVAPRGGLIDLNGNGVTCPPASASADGSPSDRQLLGRLGLFFPETWKSQITVRHHSPDSVLDGLSQTFLLAENVRAGVDPYTPGTGWACPDPYETSFFFNSRVCPSLKCTAGKVDYALANSAPGAINSSLDQPEGSAPWPSSFHAGDGANFAFADGHLRFIGRAIDGRLYAALYTPQGILLEGTGLAQGVLDEGGIP